MRMVFSSVLIIAIFAASFAGFFFAGRTYVENTRHPASDCMGAAIIFHRIWRRSAAGMCLATIIWFQSWFVSVVTFLAAIMAGYLIMPILDQWLSNRD
ncbi:MAG TPA: hypothetical protein VFF26_12230 [Gallionella sp.]|nr:hypothetical protein [Gallionella sp.]